MITEELNCETVFTIPVFGGIPVGESTVVTWIIMAALTIISILLVRNLKVENPGKKQLALEAGIGFLQDFFTDILGERGKRYVPYLITVAIYIGVANLIGLLGFKPPTKDLNVTAGLAIYDTMQYIKCDVSTVCIGMAASMGAFLLSGGKKGKRFALPNAEIMIHQPSGGAQGQATEIQIAAEHILRTKKKLNEILAANTGKPLEVIQQDTERDNFMSAEEAKEYGLIDEVIVNH